MLLTEGAYAHYYLFYIYTLFYVQNELCLLQFKGELVKVPQLQRLCLIITTKLSLRCKMRKALFFTRETIYCHSGGVVTPSLVACTVC